MVVFPPFRQSRCPQSLRSLHQPVPVLSPVSFLTEVKREVTQNLEILSMAEILHQLRLVVYPVIYQVLYILGGARFQPSTVSTENHHSPTGVTELKSVMEIDGSEMA